jgi:predicted dienelactone hydrolase
MALRRLVRSIVKGFGVLAVLVVVGIAALVIALRLEHRSALTLPTPTGAFAVGRVIDVWRDEAPDALAPTPGSKRELLVWIWYPAAGAPNGTDEYLPAAMRMAVEGARGPVINLLTRDLAKVGTHAVRNADVAPRERPFPVMLMRAGASAGVANYSTLAEDLASHGYVVVGFDAPWRTGLVVFPDGRVIREAPENNPERCLERTGAAREECVSRVLTAWTKDMSFVVDRLAQWNASDPSGRFTGRLDMERVGAFGHSLGGAASLQFCHDDPRCKAGIDIDGAPHGSVIQAGLRQPFMFLLSDHSQDSDSESRQIKADIQSIYDRLPSGGRVRREIPGGSHFLFSDDGALLKSRLLVGTLHLLGRVQIDGRRQLAATTQSVHSFFDAHL